MLPMRVEVAKEAAASQDKLDRPGSNVLTLHVSSQYDALS